MKTLGAVLLVAIGCWSCAQPQPGEQAEKFEADRQHCAALMYSARRSRGAPDWSVYDYCMEERGYRRSNRPA